MTDHILQIIRELSKERPIFHSEADFVLAVGIKIGKLPNCEIRLEYPLNVNYSYSENDKLQIAYIDMIVKTKEETIGIEFKYKTKKATVSHNNEAFNLKEQSARDVGRYLFRQDIYRLEYLLTQKKITKGLAILLTNDNKYKSEKIDERLFDGQFRLGSEIIPKTANWKTSQEYFEKNYTSINDKWISKKNGKPCWIYGTEFSKNLDLKKDYFCQWNNYSTVNEEVLSLLTVQID